MFRIDIGASQGHKLPLQIEKKLNVKEEGCAVDMHYFDTGKCCFLLIWLNEIYNCS